MQQEVSAVLAEAKTQKELLRIETKAREVRRRFLDGLNRAAAKELAIHRRG
jgi:hypothetical protein